MRNLLFGVILGLLAVVYSTPVTTVTQIPTKVDDEILHEAVTDGFLIELPSLTTESPKRNTTVPASQQPSSVFPERDIEGSAIGETTSFFHQHEHHATTTQSVSSAQSTTTSSSVPNGAKSSTTPDHTSSKTTTQSVSHAQSSTTSSSVPNGAKSSTTPDHTSSKTTTQSVSHAQSSSSTVFLRGIDHSSAVSATTQSPTTSSTSSSVPNEAKSSTTPDHTSSKTTHLNPSLDPLSSIFGSGEGEMLGQYSTTTSRMTTTTKTETSAASSTTTVTPIQPKAPRMMGGPEGSGSGSGEESRTVDLTPVQDIAKSINIESENTKTIVNTEPQKDQAAAKGHQTPGWIIIVGFIVGVAALVVLCVAIATRDKWNGPRKASQLETKTNSTNQQREQEMVTFLQNDQPKENGKAAEYTVIPLDELPEKYPSH
uniref:uncharacterized protein n=1 Tax=Semicossyphus pulcher TaxID=241346 RepID=UPI0037E90700